MNLEEIIRTPGATIVDVRTYEEYLGGHVAGSLHIPLHEIPNRLDEFKNMSKPIIVCCASGGRSGQAQRFLASNGVPAVFNGGPWTSVNYYANLQPK